MWGADTFNSNLVVYKCHCCQHRITEVSVYSLKTMGQFPKKYRLQDKIKIKSERERDTECRSLGSVSSRSGGLHSCSWHGNTFFWTASVRSSHIMHMVQQLCSWILVWLVHVWLRRRTHKMSLFMWTQNLKQKVWRNKDSSQARV